MASPRQCSLPVPPAKPPRLHSGVDDSYEAQEAFNAEHAALPGLTRRRTRLAACSSPSASNAGTTTTHSTTTAVAVLPTPSTSSHFSSSSITTTSHCPSPSTTATTTVATRDARDWEGTTLVPWALHLPRGAGAKDIKDLLLDKLHLQRGEVIITMHQPEPFLIRFIDSAHYATARNHERFQGHDIDICLQPWRSLSHTLGLRIFFQVCLYLDGILIHACTPDIVERIIGTRCTLQYINSDLPTDTRHIDLWAWTVNPSEIPKRVWLIFTHQPSNKSSSVTISTSQLDRWQHGVRYEIFLHLGVLEDYTAIACDLDDVINNPSSFNPVRWGYAWRYGVSDGAPSDARAKLPARLPGHRGNTSHESVATTNMTGAASARTTTGDAVMPGRRGARAHVMTDPSVGRAAMRTTMDTNIREEGAKETSSFMATGARMWCTASARARQGVGRLSSRGPVEDCCTIACHPPCLHKANTSCNNST
uniref:DUF4283 domain-containing protein n=1 Tax=Setaria viridis TaxID=4556 RepID=A0A4U6UXZ2_SETVI|nr:LOW QUALITY PROTEIN: hypothetical protein SEVIR_4G111400v2 [Setaria viridis]